MADSPFEVADWSIKEASTNWLSEARRRIRSVHQVIVICGEHTDKARAVTLEVALAREEDKPYFLLSGRPDKTCRNLAALKVTRCIGGHGTTSSSSSRVGDDGHGPPR